MATIMSKDDIYTDCEDRRHHSCAYFRCVQVRFHQRCLSYYGLQGVQAANISNRYKIQLNSCDFASFRDDV
jgi:hypothetical protein